MKQSYHQLKKYHGVSSVEIMAMLKYYPPGCKDKPNFITEGKKC